MYSNWQPIPLHCVYLCDEWNKVEPVHREFITSISLCMYSVTIMHVKVLVFTAVCNNSCVALGV